MESDKSWTLLASWLDRSFVRDKVGLELGREMNNRWTPDSRYVELFLNDRYQGAYLMTESVKIDGDRVDLDKEQGMIVETDGTSVVDSRLGFTSSKGIVWASKDPDEYDPSDPEQVNSAKLSAIKVADQQVRVEAVQLDDTGAIRELPRRRQGHRLLLHQGVHQGARR